MIKKARKTTRRYTVQYRDAETGNLHETTVEAKNVYDAWAMVAFPETGSCPYSAWVTEMKYANGWTKVFNSSEGNPLGE